MADLGGAGGPWWGGNLFRRQAKNFGRGGGGNENLYPPLKQMITIAMPWLWLAALHQCAMAVGRDELLI